MKDHPIFLFFALENDVLVKSEYTKDSIKYVDVHLVIDGIIGNAIDADNDPTLQEVVSVTQNLIIADLMNKI